MIYAHALRARRLGQFLCSMRSKSPYSRREMMTHAATRTQMPAATALIRLGLLDFRYTYTDLHQRRIINTAEVLRPPKASPFIDDAIRCHVIRTAAKRPFVLAH